MKNSILAAGLVILVTFLGRVEAIPITIGGFDLARSEQASLTSGSLLTELRTEIASGFVGSNLADTTTLTNAFLSSIDVLVVFTATTCCSATTPLSTTEQTALHDFVEAGGGALIFVDNDSFDAAADAVNESFLDPFGLDVTGTLDLLQTTTVTNNSHPVTNGPFGMVNSFTTNFPGFFDNLGSDALSLGTLNINNGDALAVIGSGVLSPTSGSVVFFSDNNIAADGILGQTDNRALVLNAIDFAGPQAVPEPPILLLFSVGILAGLAARMRCRMHGVR